MTKFFQFLPILLAAIFIGASWYWEIEWGMWGFVIVGLGMAALVWYGFIRKPKKKQ